MNKNPVSVYKIRFNDCDMHGHLNNARYLDYLLDAREDHLKNDYGFNLAEQYKQGNVWVVGGHEIVYLKPARYTEMVCIESTLLIADPQLLLVEMLMMDEKRSHVKSIMRTKFIPINPTTGKKSEHGEEFLNWAKTLVNSAINPSNSIQERAGELVKEMQTIKQ